MNFHQLRYIAAVDKHRNFSRAAEELGIAQSTLSREIQRLEQEFGVIIFDRSRYPVVPTMKGIDLIEQARLILKEHDVFAEIALQKDNRPHGSFRLGIFSGLAPYLVPLFAQQIAKKYPELAIEISELSPSDMNAELEGEKTDGIITILPFQKAGFYETPLFDEEFVLYLGLGHPLAAGNSVNWSEIPLEELILPDDMKTYFLEQKPKSLDKHLPAKNLENLNYQNSSLETIRKIIDRNGGLTLIPQLACLYMGERRLEMVRRIENPALTRTIGFVAPRGLQKKRLSKVILKEIAESIPEQFGIKKKKDIHLPEE